MSGWLLGFQDKARAIHNEPLEMQIDLADELLHRLGYEYEREDITRGYMVNMLIREVITVNMSLAGLIEDWGK